jgi:hypothetical protein
MCEDMGKGMGMCVVMWMHKFGGDKLDDKVRLYIRIRCGQNMAVYLLRARFPLIDDNILYNNRSLGLATSSRYCGPGLLGSTSTIHNPQPIIHYPLSTFPLGLPLACNLFNEPLQ